MLLQVEMG